MSKRFLFTAFCVSILSFSLADFSHAGRGGGGGSRGGGGARGGGGGGFSGGVSRGGGGMGGGMSGGMSGGGAVGGVRPSPSMGAGGGARPVGGAGAGSAGPGARPGAGMGAGGPAVAGGGARPGTGAGMAGPAGVGGGGRPGAGVGTAGAARVGGASAGASAAAANRYNAPSRNDLSGFLGLPSDEGFGHASTASTRQGTMSSPSTLPAREGNVDVNYGKTEGPRGGQVGGVTATGPQGNTIGKAAAVGPQGGAAVVGGVQGAAGGTAVRGAAVGPQGGAAVVGGVQGAAGGTAVRGAAVGPQGGAAVVGGVQGAAGGTAVRGAAVGPNGQVVAGRGAVGPGGYGAGGVVTAGPAGIGAGFTRISPAGRYTAAAAVRGTYNNWGIYGTGWRVQYPGAWVAAGWTTAALWSTATWGTAASYCGYAEQPPVYYDYGTSVVYEDNSVYVNGDVAGTTEEYYDQAASLAATGAEAKTQSDGDWLPLGVFAFTKAENPTSDITIQLAVNKDGVIRGNYTDTATKQNQVVQGSVDKQTQRVAFTVGDNKANIIETGLYNLTKEESPCLIHLGKDSTEQWLLVRLQNPEASAG
ncbi:MAG: protocadherin [Planctomycetota bacterium]|nr:protocadherin [Planctomycetota bacterium]